MPGWIQHPITYELIPREEYVRPKEVAHSVFGDIESFVSPIDGEVITGRAGLKKHMRKHNVVNSAEYSPEFLNKKREEREFRLNGGRTKDEIRSDKMAMYQALTDAGL